MGSPKTHIPVKLFYAVLLSKTQNPEDVEFFLSERHGEIDLKSEAFNFNYTGYYEKEMGMDIKRIFYSFKKLIPAQELSNIKILSNAAELKFLSASGGRTLNFDPGYLTNAKVILASAKDNIQRIYIGNGIYEEITLYYKNNTFNAFEWTFPDYKQSYIPFFNQLRKRYSSQLKALKNAAAERN